MDPLSTAASVLTVLAAAGKVGDGLQQLLFLVHAPDELTCLINEVGWETRNCKLRC